MISDSKNLKSSDKSVSKDSSLKKSSASNSVNKSENSNINTEKSKKNQIVLIISLKI